MPLNIRTAQFSPDVKCNVDGTATNLCYSLFINNKKMSMINLLKHH